jgi:Tripartite tricarboxylate transporter family receptor
MVPTSRGGLGLRPGPALWGRASFKYQLPSALSPPHSSRTVRQPGVPDVPPRAWERNLGAEAALHAPAEGYTLLLVETSQTISATLYDKLNFNIAHDLAPIAGLIIAEGSLRPLRAEAGNGRLPAICSHRQPGLDNRGRAVAYPVSLISRSPMLVFLLGSGARLRELRRSIGRCRSPRGQRQRSFLQRRREETRLLRRIPWSSPFGKRCPRHPQLAD